MKRVLEPGDIVTMAWARKYPQYDSPRMIVVDVTGYYARAYCYYSGDMAHGWNHHHGRELVHIKVSDLIKVEPT